MKRNDEITKRAAEPWEAVLASSENPEALRKARERAEFLSRKHGEAFRAEAIRLEEALRLEAAIQLAEERELA